MTEHNHQHDKDNELSALYKSTSQEDPPQQLDDAVLAAARRHVKSRPHVISPFSRRWPVSAGLAAVLVLSIGVVTIIENEAPEKMTDAPADFYDEFAAKPPPRQLEQDRIVKSNRKTSAEPVLQPVPAPIPVLEKKQAIAVTPPVTASHPLRDLAKRPTATEHTTAEDQFRKGDQLEARRFDLHRQEKTLQQKKDVARKRAKSLSLKKPQQGAIARSRISTDSTTQTKTVQIQPQPMTHAASIQSASAGIEAQERESIATPGKAESVPAPAEEAITGARQFALTPSVLPESIQSDSDKEVKCTAMPLQDCLNSGNCTLELIDNRPGVYQCRAAIGDCESDFSQALSTALNCNTKRGCRYLPERCFCLPNTGCDCRGGPPARCQRINTD